MGRSNKFDYQAAIETVLIAHPEGLSLDELVEHSGLQVDRSTLFRHLTHLLESGRAERVGKARASRYRPLAPARTTPDPESSETQRAHETVRTEPESVPSQASAHDAVVKKAVRTIVHDWKRFDRVNLQIYLSLLVRPERVNELGAAVEKELAGLREDNLDQFGLTQDDFSRYIPPAGNEASGRKRA